MKPTPPDDRILKEGDTGEDDNPKSFRIKFMWRFVLIRMAGFYQEGKPEGEVLLERLSEYLEQSSLDVADFLKWDGEQK